MKLLRECIINSLKALVHSSYSFLCLEHPSLLARDLRCIRRAMTSVCGKYMVVPRRLWTIAIESSFGCKVLCGKTTVGVLFMKNNFSETIKTFVDETKKVVGDKYSPMLLLGMIDNGLLSEKDTKNMASLKTQDELFVELNSMFLVPAFNFIQVFEWPIMILVLALDNIARDKNK